MDGEVNKRGIGEGVDKERVASLPIILETE